LVEAPASAPAEAGEVVGSSARSSWCLIVTGGGGDGRTATAAGGRKLSWWARWLVWPSRAWREILYWVDDGVVAAAPWHRRQGCLPVGLREVELLYWIETEVRRRGRFCQIEHLLYWIGRRGERVLTNLWFDKLNRSRVRS
jgi:hypothetical protein